MAMTDPIGDLITRIRNAQQRAKSKVSTPASKLRERVLEVLKTEGYIRGYATVEHGDGRSEIEMIASSGNVISAMNAHRNACAANTRQRCFLPVTMAIFTSAPR